MRDDGKQSVPVLPSLLQVLDDPVCRQDRYGFTTSFAASAKSIAMSF
ncbi:MAG TPA: hypothetical protein PLY00_17330 [Verrucomicrobiota bacterium]|jgi:hypothetical protein|nr:hypothetical protein [Verrucomicrobiota bacterium]HOR73021.1 hypothetical protein [Verrucomicrobiota bacterium]HPV12315.1 hypothetical protein [Verrucomicrobiota bacterium]HQK02269.1 hypothetical protein [Verrucomicrobiota bacterium]